MSRECRLTCFLVPALALVLSGCVGGPQPIVPDAGEHGPGPVRVSKPGQSGESQLPPKPSPREQLEAQWGIRLESVRLTAAGFMVDFRYRVLDKELAGPILDKHLHPFLTHQKTGRKLAVPSGAKTGPMRNSGRAKVGIIYFILFGNNPQVVEHGDLVNITVGDLVIPDVIVQ